MLHDVPMLPVVSYEHNVFNDQRTTLGISNLMTSYRTKRQRGSFGRHWRYSPLKRLGRQGWCADLAGREPARHHMAIWPDMSGPLIV